MVNGSPTREFSPSCGLRQGDPISPLLLNLVVEVLSALILKAKLGGFLRGIKLASNGYEVTHVQFADDALIVINNDVESIKAVKNILLSFQLLSGLKVNFSKSKIYSRRVGAHLLQQGSSIMGCEIGNWPFNYLGVTIGPSPKRRLFWDPLFDQVNRKLANWKVSNLNMDGRMVLLKSTIDSLPSYRFNVFLISSRVSKKLDALRRSFLWGECGEEGRRNRKIHLIKWERMLLPNNQGGLYITPIELKNRAMLGKWLFKWHSNRKTEWNTVIKSKYSCLNS